MPRKEILCVRDEFALSPVDLKPQPAEVPEGGDLVLIGSPFERKAKKWSVSRGG